MKDRRDFIIRCLVAYSHQSPPPADAESVDITVTSKPQLGRYMNVARYVDEQLTKRDGKRAEMQSFGK